MGLLNVIGFCGAIGLIMTVFDASAFKQKRRQWPLFGKIWHHTKVGGLAIIFSYVAGAVTSGVLIAYVFKNQNPYIFSGSPVTVISFVFWAVIGIWVAMGREKLEDDADLDLATSEGRLNWFVERAVMKVAGFILKWGIWLIVLVVGTLLIYFVSSLVGQRLEAMSSAQAIVLAGIIIAVAILAVGQRR